MPRRLNPGRRVGRLVWWLGAVISSGFVVLGAARIGVSNLPPRTPFDATASGHDAQWRFLAEASQLLPGGTTLTVRADDHDTEMSLYMMAVGLFPEATVVPGSYYGRAVAASATARFVLAFGGTPSEGIEGEVTEVLAGGLLIDRRPAAQ